MERAEKALKFLLGMVSDAKRIEAMDNRELLWRCMNTPFWKRVNSMPLNSPTVNLLAELENRMYPEYDGDNVEFMPWGWKTPEGDIRYEDGPESKTPEG